MASFRNFERVYDPDSLRIMAVAFDSAHKSLIQCVLLTQPCSISYDEAVGAKNDL